MLRFVAYFNGYVVTGEEGMNGYKIPSPNEYFPSAVIFFFVTTPDGFRLTPLPLGGLTLVHII